MNMNFRNNLDRNVNELELVYICSRWHECSACQTVCDPMDYRIPGSSVHPWDFPVRILEWVCHFLFQRIFPTQGSNLHLPSLLIGRQVLYHWAT